MSNLTKIKPLIDFTPEDKRISQQEAIPGDLTLEEAIDLGLLVSGLEVMARTTIYNSCYLEPWHREIGNIKDNDVMYPSPQIALEYPELSKYVTNTVGLFAGYNKNSIDISQHDFSNVWNTDSMFKDCYNVKTINLGNNNFSKNVDAAHMFENCYQLRRIEGVENMDVSKVLSLNSCFKNCENIARLNLKDWCTPFLEDIAYCWYNCKTLSCLKIDNIDTSICKNFDGVVGGDTLVQIRNVKKDLLRMAFVGESILKDNNYDEEDLQLYSRLEKVKKLKMQKYEENPILLALALKVAKNIKGMDFKEQEEILNALCLSKEDFEFLNENFLKESYKDIDVSSNGLLDIVEEIENLREEIEVDF